MADRQNIIAIGIQAKKKLLLSIECQLAINAYIKPNRLSKSPRPDSFLGTAWETSWLCKLSRVALAGILLLLKVMFVLIISTVVIYTAFNTFVDYGAIYHSAAFWNIQVPMTRSSRMVSMTFSLHKLPQFQDAHHDFCLLINPFYEVSNPPCFACKGVKVVDLTGMSEFTFQRFYQYKGTPFITKNVPPTPTNMQAFTKILLETGNFEELPTGADSSLDLEIIRTNVSRALRKIFPPPLYIPRLDSIHPKQYIFMDGPYSSSYSLPMTWYENVFIMQIQGLRRIELMPVRHCKAECSSLSIDLEPGDILYYTWYFWKTSSNLVPGGQDSDKHSINIVGHFF
ncbi:Bombesin receptor-activated protein C6orf89 [Orchesella cincta]|uniref:Bombesin receptor-activated protein C6orf89 n=1 Tax=Orchesella cincta TaxID=48709 RepID=A0A1D2MCH8_ORCCI|nr:Bombesin receptor-activated protein C6orf89 [Orchesella cincta]